MLYTSYIARRESRSSRHSSGTRMPRASIPQRSERTGPPRLFLVCTPPFHSSVEARQGQEKTAHESFQRALAREAMRSRECVQYSTAWQRRSRKHTHRHIVRKPRSFCGLPPPRHYQRGRQPSATTVRSGRAWSEGVCARHETTYKLPALCLEDFCSERRRLGSVIRCLPSDRFVFTTFPSFTRRPRGAAAAAAQLDSPNSAATLGASKTETR